MISKSSLFQARYSSTLLCSAMLAIALIMQASPAHSETIDLACASTDVGSNRSFRIQIDTDRRMVTEFWSNGTTYQYPVTISDQFIRYTQPKDISRSSGTTIIDRMAGTLVFTPVYDLGEGHSSYFACRRATQKF